MIKIMYKLRCRTFSALIYHLTKTEENVFVLKTLMCYSNCEHIIMQRIIVSLKISTPSNNIKLNSTKRKRKSRAENKIELLVKL